MRVYPNLYEQGGNLGFVKDFIREGAGDLGFLSMSDRDQELWLKIIEAEPQLLSEINYDE